MGRSLIRTAVMVVLVAAGVPQALFAGEVDFDRAVVVDASAAGEDSSMADGVTEMIDRWTVPAGGAADRCDPHAFLRRVSLDRLGRGPSVAEIDAFMTDGADRRRLVRELCDAPERYAEGGSAEAATRLADFWTARLAPASTEAGVTATPLRNWLYEAFGDRRDIDAIASELVDPALPGGRALYEAVGGTTANYTSAIARGLMGVRLDCAQCHDHPFADWTQTNFWQFAAHFGDTVAPGDDGVATYEGVRYRSRLLPVPGDDEASDDEAGDDEADDDEADGGDAGAGRRGGPGEVAAWLTDDGHPFFAANLVNRTFQWLVGQPLVRPAADLDQVDASEIQRLRRIGRKAAAGGFDAGDLFRSIMRTEVYGRVAGGVAGGASGGDTVNRRVKVLTPRQVFASLERGLLLPVGRLDGDSARHNGLGGQLMRRLGEASVDDPSRYAAGVPQMLMLLNGPLTTAATGPDGRLLTAVTTSPFLDTPQSRVETLYLSIVHRPPTAAERSVSLAQIDAHGDAAYADILWSLINHPEVVLCR